MNETNHIQVRPTYELASMRSCLAVLVNDKANFATFYV